MAGGADGGHGGGTPGWGDSPLRQFACETRKENTSGAGGELWCDVMDQRLHRPQTASPRLPRLLRPARRPRPARPATPWLERLLWLLARPAPPRYSPLLPGEFPRRPAQPAYNYRPARVCSLEKPNPSESRGLAQPDLAAGLPTVGGPRCFNCAATVAPRHHNSPPPTAASATRHSDQ